METLWSMSTTIREAERIEGFLKTAKEIEGELWYSGAPAQKKFQVLLVKNRQFLNDPENTQSHNKLNEEQCRILDDKNIDMTYEMAESIIEAKQYVGGPEMRGRQSMSPLVKLGLVYYEMSTPNKRVRISDVGNKLLNGEISFEDFMRDALLKYQYPNPSEKGFQHWNTKPFINTLKLIKEVNGLCVNGGIEPKGISTIEFGIFVLSLRKYDRIHQTALDLLDFRRELNSKPNNEKDLFVDSYIQNYLREFNNPTDNCREYTDNMIRYMRMTKYIYIRGKYDHTYIDLEPRRMKEIDAILSHDNGEAQHFTQAEWNEYIGTYGAYVLPFETQEALTAIANDVITEIHTLEKELGMEISATVIPSSVEELKKYIEQKREERTILQNLVMRKDVHQDFGKIDDAVDALTYILTHNKAKLVKKYSIELEKWTNVALNILDDAKRIKPNSPVGDDNEPVYTAPSGVADIECYYDTFNAICEVTMLTSRDQWFNEGQPVMRHLRDFENINEALPSYCLFVAPTIHKDTINTFYTSVKYEYEGQKQRIIPITISQLQLLLKVVKTNLQQQKAFTHNYIKQLYDACVDLSDIADSTQWLEKINNSITQWSERLTA